MTSLCSKICIPLFGPLFTGFSQSGQWVTIYPCLLAFKTFFHAGCASPVNPPRHLLTQCLEQNLFFVRFLLNSERSLVNSLLQYSQTVLTSALPTLFALTPHVLEQKFPFSVNVKNVFPHCRHIPVHSLLLLAALSNKSFSLICLF